MKKKISEWLLRMAKILDPQGEVENVPEVVDYEPKKIGMRLMIDKKELRKYKGAHAMSEREARKEMVKEAKLQIRDHVCDVIQRQGLIEYAVTQGEEKEVYVDGHMKVYVRK